MKTDSLLKAQQALYGAAGVVATSLVVKIQDIQAAVESAKVRFREGECEVGSPVGDNNLEVQEFLKENVLEKEVETVLTLVAKGFNTLALQRRNIYMLGADEKDRKWLNDFQPANGKLFGGNGAEVTEVNKNLATFGGYGKDLCYLLLEKSQNSRGVDDE